MISHSGIGYYTTSASSRRKRLLGLAFLRRALQVFPDDDIYRMMVWCESAADGGTTFKKFRPTIAKWYERNPADGSNGFALKVRLVSSLEALSSTPIRPRHIQTVSNHCTNVCGWERTFEQGWRHYEDRTNDEKEVHLDLAKCIIDRPNLSPGLSNSNLKNSDIWKIACQVYNAHDWAAKDILADALEEAGFIAESSHMRDPYHGRGCHVLDGILGYS